MDVDHRLAQIERKQDRTYILLEALTVKVEELSVSSEEWRGRVERTIWGVNGNADDSLVVRLDRLEQTHHTQTWVVRVAATVIIAATVGGLWSLLAV